MANFLEKPGELYGRLRDRTMQPGRLGRGVLRTLAWVVPAAARAEAKLVRLEKLDVTTAQVTASVARALGLPASTTAYELAAYFEVRTTAITAKDPAAYAHAPELAVASDGQVTDKAA